MEFFQPKGGKFAKRHFPKMVHERLEWKENMKGIYIYIII